METLAGHLRGQGFVVVASGPVADGRTKIYACARGIGVEALFFAELVRYCLLGAFALSKTSRCFPSLGSRSLLLH